MFTNHKIFHAALSAICFAGAVLFAFDHAIGHAVCDLAAAFVYGGFCKDRWQPEDPPK